MKKILVLGCNGMAGHLISLYFQERGYDVVGFARSASPLLQQTIVGDALDFSFIRETIEKGDYAVVINCIGLLNKFAEDNKDQAVLLNSYLPHYLCAITKGTKTRIFHMSTDCVFAGNDGPYLENSFPNGVSFYDRSKALGEIKNDKDLSFRNSIIGPDIKPSGIGLFNWFMKQSGNVDGYTGAIWTGVTTLCLAQAMEYAISEHLTGLYNLVNNKSISKYELLGLFNKHFRANEIKITSNNKIHLDKTLKSTRHDFSFQVPSYEQQIIELRHWVDSHISIYPHYNVR